MAMNLENIVNQATAQYVKIKEHREPYTAHYNALKDKVYSEWKSSAVLGKLLKGSTLCGMWYSSISPSILHCHV